MESKLSLNKLYNYKDRLNMWRKFATKNDVIISCEKCNKTHAHKSVLLETGEQACWYCWISKGTIIGKVVAKSNAKPKTKSEPVAKPTPKKVIRSTVKPVTKLQPKVQKPIDNKKNMPNVSLENSRNALVQIKKEKEMTKAIKIKSETLNVSKGEFPCPEHKQTNLSLLPKQKLRKLKNYRSLMWSKKQK